MDRKELERRLVEATRPIVKDFLDAPSSAQEAHKAEADRIRKAIETEKDDLLKRALEDGLKRHLARAPDGSDRSAEAAKAWDAAGRRVGAASPATRKKSGRRSSSKSSGRQRRSAEKVSDAADEVYKALSPKSYRTRAELREKTGIEGGLMRSALSRLKREDRIESNGLRGPQGGYRRAPASKN